MKFLCLLTQYKRPHLEKQLEAISKQTLKPDYLIVFQNESHVDISDLKTKYDFIHMKSDFNTKFFGRFAACFTYDVDYCIVMDDDIIPARECFENYISESVRLNGITGGNGRFNSDTKLVRKSVPDVGIRNESIEIDFVGHLWCFKKDWLYYMFAIKPCTYETGEDMHLCFTSKVLGRIKSYVCKQDTPSKLSDVTGNALAVDAHSSFITTGSPLRKSIQTYFIDNYDLNKKQDS